MSSTQEKNVLQCLPAGAAASDILAAIEKDGGVIIMDLLTKDQVNRINTEIDPQLTAQNIGNAGDVDHMVEFSGRYTKRISRMVPLSKVFREEVINDENLHAYTNAFLLPSADSYWLSTAQIIEIYPGQKAQILHRDCENYAMFRTFGANAPDILCNYLIALSDYTEEMGATRVVPGSHKWEDFEGRDYMDQTVPVVLEPGWACLMSGKLLHCGGANVSDKPRRGMAMVYSLGWLTPEEAHPFVIPIEMARQLTPRAQQLLGFRSFHDPSHNGYSLWQIDYVDISKHLGMETETQR